MEYQKHTSLKDLAKALGVSIPTVSRALKDSPEISSELRAKVKKLAKEMNYKGTSCSYCGNTRGISEFSNNQQINCAIRSLQDQCAKHGNGKPKQRLEHRSFCKTYFFFDIFSS